MKIKGRVIVFVFRSRLLWTPLRLSTRGEKRKVGKGKERKSTDQQEGERQTPGCMHEFGLGEKVQSGRG